MCHDYSILYLLVKENERELKTKETKEFRQKTSFLLLRWRSIIFIWTLTIPDLSFGPIARKLISFSCFEKNFLNDARFL